ncbi:peptidoglycan-binding protein [Streptomyces sp. NPDC052042]|uniref:peptidoglycan-binding domain-containing protein n=1 Tax=Streptomyces sp. NPDC052042 TaxID=3365683 RepID=UPI0037D810A1
MTGHICPECGMRTFPPTTAGGFSGVNGDPGAGPVCACGGHGAWRGGEQGEAAERRRAERAAADRADIAAAEDFDPLRIRPYVKLEVDVTPETDDAWPLHSGRSPHAPAEGFHRPAEDADSTMPLPLYPPRGDDPAGTGGPSPFEAWAGHGAPAPFEAQARHGEPRWPDGRAGHDDPARSGERVGPGGPTRLDDPTAEAADPVGATAFLPTVAVATSATPAVEDTAVPVSVDTTVLGNVDGSDRSRRRRPLAALAVGAAAIAVVGTAVFAGGLLESKDDGAADRELALPDLPPSTPEASETAEGSASAPAPPPPSERASASPSTSATAPSSADASPSPSASATSIPPSDAEPPASAPQASRPPSAEPPASLAGPALRPGDRGPAVADLQRRLGEVWLFHGRDDGDYTEQVERAVRVYQSYKFIEGDPPGVYGPHTRRALEAETSGRGRS